jgi:thiol:disulfide interchange protein DsbA
MRISRRDFSAAILGTALFGRTVADGLTPSTMQGDPIDGRQFLRVQPSVPTLSTGRIEVLEFFSYACPHCNAFEPDLRAWSDSAPKDIALQRIPVPYIGAAVVLQRTFFALEASGGTPAAHARMFDAIHVQKRRIESVGDAAAALRGAVDATVFRAAFMSDAVSRRVALADNLVKAYGVTGVPTLAVQGNFLTSREMAGSAPNTLKTVDYLIGLARRG